MSGSQIPADACVCLFLSFGAFAEAVNDGGISGGLAQITEETGRLLGRILNVPTDLVAAGWNALVPDFLRINKAAGFGDPLIAAVDKAEAARKKAIEDAKKYNNDFEREAKRAKEVADRNKPANLPKQAPDGKGGYGVTPEATIKANEAAQKRIEDAKIEVAVNLLLSLTELVDLQFAALPDLCLPKPPPLIN